MLEPHSIKQMPWQLLKDVFHRLNTCSTSTRDWHRKSLGFRKWHNVENRAKIHHISNGGHRDYFIVLHMINYTSAEIDPRPLY